MSLINEYRSTEEAIKELQARLAQLEGDDRLKKELEFEEKLRELMGSYGKSLKDVIALLDPQSARSTKSTATTPRRERKLKKYVNPNNGETIETKGGNHKTLKAWKEKYGADTVESWLQA